MKTSQLMLCMEENIHVSSEIHTKQAHNTATAESNFLMLNLVVHIVTTELKSLTIAITPPGRRQITIL